MIRYAHFFLIFRVGCYNLLIGVSIIVICWGDVRFIGRACSFCHSFTLFIYLFLRLFHLSFAVRRSNVTCFLLSFLASAASLCFTIHMIGRKWKIASFIRSVTSILIFCYGFGWIRRNHIYSLICHEDCLFLSYYMI